ncbi:MAG: hypothetical protein M3Z92_16635 [Bacteroidota bacterium]|nr:hypothetical protein [Bacteroidota bacterium]
MGAAFFITGLAVFLAGADFRIGLAIVFAEATFLGICFFEEIVLFELLPAAAFFGTAFLTETCFEAFLGAIFLAAPFFTTAVFDELLDKTAEAFLSGVLVFLPVAGLFFAGIVFFCCLAILDFLFCYCHR